MTELLGGEVDDWGTPPACGAIEDFLTAGVVCTGGLLESGYLMCSAKIMDESLEQEGGL